MVQRAFWAIKWQELRRRMALLGARQEVRRNKGLRRWPWRGGVRRRAPEVCRKWAGRAVRYLLP